MLDAQPDFDPHNLKHEGELTPRSAHVNEPYTHQEYPKVLYKTVDGKQVSATVDSKEAEDAAQGDGFGAEVTEAPEVRLSTATYAHLVFTDDAGFVVGFGEKQKITLVEPLAPVSVTYEGSGSERWPDNDWTQTGDGTNYPGLPTQAEADAAAAE